MYRLLRTIGNFSLLFVLLSSAVSTFAQIEVTGAGTGVITPENLITNVFLGQGVEVTSLQYQGASAAVGYFTNGQGDIGIDRGIVMSSGQAVTAATENGSGSTTGNTSGTTITDPDLAQIANANIQDVAIYTIKFIPINDTLRFKFAFASEEYPEWACSNFNDAFGFFISGPGITGPFSNNGQNIALVPDPADPSGLTFTNVPVTINNVNGQGIDVAGGCLFDYGVYYNDNAGSQTLTYDGFLDVFTAQAVVIPCQEYTIKLAICDRGDPLYDSAVFLEAKSFGTGALKTNILTTSLDFTIAEGCDEGFFEINLPLPAEEVLTLDYTIIGSATPGVDYEAIPADLVIPAGDSSLVIPVIAFEDSLQEGSEQVCLDIQLDPCNRDTFCITIRDPLIVKPDLGPDTSICVGSAVQLDATLDIPLPQPATFFSEEALVIAPVDVALFSEIDVSGVLPGLLQEGVIKQVCLDTILHPWLDDLDIYLIAPGGQFVELTTDNGANGDNYIGTCFTISATNPISAPGPFAPADSTPFTGTYLPEGVWSDLWDGDNPTNGTWRLQIVDDANGFTGTLNQWSICFEPIYDLRYEWDPVPGLSCYDCPDPVAQPDSTTSYVVRVTDSYGCETKDTILITINNDSKPVIDQVLITPASCVGVDDGTLTVLASGQNQPFLYGLDGGMLVDSGWFDSLAAGIYEVQVLGATGCVEALDIEVPPADTLLIALQIAQAVSCDAGSDGVVVAAPFGGTPGYSYLWSDGTISDTLDGVSQGVYNLTVTDANGCEAVDSIAVTDPSPISLLFSVADVECYQTPTGAATAVPAGGSGSYQFQWDNAAGGQTTATATGLLAGTYGVTVTDGAGCTAEGTAAVQEASLIQLVLNGVGVSCFGNADGLTSATALGGAGGFTYLWNTGAQGSLQTGLSAGIYVVTATDVNGCTVTDSVVIAQPDSLILYAVSVDSTACANAGDGAIGFSVAGGTPISSSNAYAYQWSDGSPEDSIRSGLNAGSYSVTVSDARGCTATGQFEVEGPDALALSVNVVEASCPGEADGEATASVIGGTAPYAYTWSNGLIGGPTVSGLTPGSYSVTVIDAQGCPASLQFEVGSPPSLILDLTVTDADCAGQASGAATAMVSGGSPGYAISWSDGQSGPTATLLAEGTYSVSAVDQQGCLVEETFSISEPPLLTADLSVTMVACSGGSDGAISATVAGGTPPVVSEWSNGTTGSLGIGGLQTGQYSVTLTDANGCQAIATAEIEEPDAPLMLALSFPDTLCFGASNGSVTASPSGGTAPYQLAWSNGQTGPAATGLSAGTVEVTVTDANGCLAEESGLVDAYGQMTVDLQGTPPACFQGADGSIEVTGVFYSGIAAPVSAFSFQWSTVPPQTGAFATGLAGGQSYEVTVTNGSGCSAVEGQQLLDPPPVAVQVVSQTDASCNGGSDGTATVLASGGGGGFTYLWDNAAGSQTDATATGLSLGVYMVTATDANGCEAVTGVSIDEPITMVISGWEVTEVKCYGDADGELRVLVEGGNPPYSVIWSNGQSGVAASGLPAGLYTATITDQSGCTIDATQEVPQPTDRILPEAKWQDASCHGYQDGSIRLSAQGGTEPYSYSLNGQDFSGQPNFLNVPVGTYGRLSVRDANGCVALADTVMVSEPLPLIVDLGPDLVIRYGDSVQLLAVITNAQGAVLFEWVTNDTLLCENGQVVCLNPWVRPEYRGEYQLIVADSNGCRASDRVIVDVELEKGFYVPTGFTPNGDGLNDLLRTHGRTDIEVTMFRVYDRWGELLYERGGFGANDGIGWDGTFGGRSMPGGLYIWYAEVQYANGRRELFQGESQMIR